MVVGASQHKTINVNMYDLSSQVFAKLSNEQPIKYDWNEKEGICKSRHKMKMYDFMKYLIPSYTKSIDAYL